MLFCFRLWQMKEVLRWSVRNGAGLVWPRGLATLQARTLVLCCARTTRGSSIPLKCSSLVPDCRYHTTYSLLSFLCYQGWSVNRKHLKMSPSAKSSLGTVWCIIHFLLVRIKIITVDHLYIYRFSCKLSFYIISSIASQSTMMVRMWIRSTSPTPSLCDSLCSHPK